MTTIVGIVAQRMVVWLDVSRIAAPRYMLIGIMGSVAAWPSIAPAMKRRSSGAGVNDAERNGSSADRSAP